MNKDYWARLAEIKHLQYELMMDYPLTVIVPIGAAVLIYCLIWRMK